MVIYQITLIRLCSAIELARMNVQREHETSTKQLLPESVL